MYNKLIYLNRVHLEIKNKDMKIIVIGIMVLWIVGYIIATIRIANSKDRISIITLVLLILFPYLWIFLNSLFLHRKD